VQIVRNSDFRVEGENRLRAGWSHLLRAPLEVTFEYLPKLDPEPSGKFRHVVSELQGGQSLSSSSQQGRLPRREELVN